MSKKNKDEAAAARKKEMDHIMSLYKRMKKMELSGFDKIDYLESGCWPSVKRNNLISQFRMLLSCILNWKKKVSSFKRQASSSKLRRWTA
jgi:hypothetical protein